MALLEGALALFGGQQADKRRAKEARLSRAFQERMSSTAFQRQAKDLTAAGLNRILGLSGSGASTPGGAMAAQQDFITPAVNTALAAKRLKADIKLIEERAGMVKDQRDVLAPAKEVGSKIGEWIHTITNFDWGEAAKTIFQDLQISGEPNTAKALEIDVTKGKKEQTHFERSWLQRYKKGARASHGTTRQKP